MTFAKDYIDVATRIAEFRAKHPEGTLQSEVIRWPEEGYPFIVVRAEAYRTPDDPRPGVGLAGEPYPGQTSFTRGSELQNAETSAWGRALVAVGAADTKQGVASADEVRNRASEPAPGAPGSSAGTAGSEERGGEGEGDSGLGEGREAAPLPPTHVTAEQQQALLERYGTAADVRAAYESLTGNAWPGGAHLTADEVEGLLE